MDDRPTHKITMTVTGNYAHGTAEHASVTVSGDGSLDQYVEAFKSFLVASGFAMDTAKKFDEVDV